MPVYPISFSIPECKVRTEVPEKTQRMATLVPGDTSTYVFNDETSYYEGYARSVFGRTHRKGGWDCMRHYEILANGCIPWFDGLDECPSRTMTHFPKALVKEAMTSQEPESYIPRLLEYTRTHLTTRARAQYILDTCGHSHAKRVLFLSEDQRPDYLRCLTLVGFKELLGKDCAESVVVPHIYDDYGPTSTLYGRGFSYARTVPSSLKPDLIHIDDIRLHRFDLVVYGSIHRGLPYYDEVMKYYTPSEVVLLCGEDGDVNSDHHVCVGMELSNKGHPVFIREIPDDKIVVQIGTNTGKDHVRDLVGKIPTSLVLLVEPFDIHNESIKNAYGSIRHVVENIAIVPDNRDSVSLYYHDDDGPRNNPNKSFQVASIIPQHIQRHDYDGKTIQSVNVRACTLNHLFAKYDLTTIDYLFMDIEGIDMDVLESIDFTTYNIKKLQIEHLHLDANRLHSFMSQRGYRATPGMDYHGFDTMFIKN
jgi:FkbM family methyltransferase